MIIRDFLKYIYWCVVWLIAYLAIRQISNGYFSDALNLHSFSQTSTTEYFKLICGATSTIFAILISVVTFSYGLLGKSSRRRKRFSIISNWLVSFYISVAVAVIIFSLYSCFTIPNLSLDKDLTTAYFIGILFISFVILLLPFTIYTLKKDNTIPEIKKKISQKTDEIKFETLPNQITDELIYYIQELDSDAYYQILTALNNKFLLLIANKTDERQPNRLLKTVLKVWDIGNVKAKRENEIQYFNTIWIQVEELYKYAAKEKLFLLKYNSLNEFIGIQIEFLAAFNCIDGLKTGAKTLSSIFQTQLKCNSRPEETISELYWTYIDDDAPNPIIDNGLHWGKITELLREIGVIQSVAIELKSKELFEVVSFELDYISSNIKFNFYSELGKYQEAEIVEKIYSSLTYYAYQALESGLYKNSEEAYHFGIDDLKDAILNNKEYVKDVLKTITKYIIDCQKIKVLHKNAIQNLAKLARPITKIYLSNEIAKSIFNSIIDIFKLLKEMIEEENNLVENENYQELKTQLTSIREYQNKLVNPLTTEMLNQMDNILDSFKL